MSKEKLVTLGKYVDQLKSKLADTTVPEKHKNHPKEYREFLEREFKKANSKLEALRMSVSENKRG